MLCRKIPTPLLKDSFTAQTFYYEGILFTSGSIFSNINWLFQMVIGKLFKLILIGTGSGFHINRYDWVIVMKIISKYILILILSPLIIILSSCNVSEANIPVPQYGLYSINIDGTSQKELTRARMFLEAFHLQLTILSMGIYIL